MEKNMYLCSMKYKENYEVYEDGRIFSYKSNKFMKPFTLGGTYLGVSIDRKPEYVHRIVATCFIENIETYSDVNHKDGDKHNNNVINLEWCSRAQNVKYSYDVLGRKGRPQNFWKGKNHTEEAKNKIRLARLKK